MSLDISLYDRSKPEGEQTVADMNWLRNPFGLERWAYWNTRQEYGPDKTSLYYVCNQWAYSNIDQGDPHFTNRKLFYNVVWDHLAILARKYGDDDEFYFAFENNMQITKYVTAYREWFPNDPGSRGHRIDGALWLPDTNGNDMGTLLVPMRHFDEPHIEGSIKLGREWNRHRTIVQQYMAWYYDLMYFAKALVEHPEYEFYCSN